MIKERILQFVDFKGVKREVFYGKIGMTSANFRGKAKETPINSTAIENILSEYPDLNLEWLITGSGEMVKGSTQNVRIEGQNKNLNNINGSSNVTISQNDISEIIEIQREMNNIIKTTQSQLSESQQQVSNLIEILKNK
ncbi:hypothetical protein N4T42_02125 [Riemerella anatipestifer]|uniref:hypothetical protein n=1 Tax=Riemerella anatipestifer TaxID=34085 RepID=UPI0021D5E0FE|nr:hypothetical protein [Riemerella anatipestifer]MCU7559099.1 hypothetical protein [Riemerella anatipestifer]MDY3400671.1 hypothetical protein [Riemerella anatipestifer]